MDNRNFDDLAKELAAARSRRDALKKLGRTLAIAVGIGGPVGGILWSSTGDASSVCRPGGRTCREHANCCTGTCLPRDETGRRRCLCEPGTTPCGDECCARGEACIAGHCQTPTPVGTATNTATPTNTPTPTPTPTNTPPPCAEINQPCQPGNITCCDGLQCSQTEQGPTGFQCTQIP